MAEQEPFAQLYQRQFQAVYRVCYTYMKNPYDAEDCTEDAFVHYLRHPVVFENERHERSWLTVTAMNVCKDRLKHWWHKKTVPLEDYEQTLAAPEQDQTLEAVMALPPKYKDVIYLHYYEGYKTDEIAAMLHRPASTVRNQLRDAREKLRVQLGGDGL